jgi:hypothetical protein
LIEYKSIRNARMQQPQAMMISGPWERRTLSRLGVGMYIR